jgi:acetyl esterase/lipase
MTTFPGAHYGVDGPVLYYSSELFGAAGWDTLAVTYDFQSAGVDFSPGMFPDLLEECQAVLQAARDERSYPQLVLVGKSLGAMVVAHMCAQSWAQHARVGYLAPPLSNAFFAQSFRETSQASYLAIGTKDRFYDSDALRALRESKIFQLTLVEGADHSFDVAGDLDQSLAGIRRVVGDLVNFLIGD